MTVGKRAAGSDFAAEETPATAGERPLASVLPFPLALASVVMTYWTVDIISPALPEIKEDLALSAAGAGLVWSLLFVGRLAGNFPAALLLDRLGAAVTAGIGGIFLSGGSLLAATADDQLLLFPARIVQGVGVSLLVNAGLRSILRAKPGQGAAMTFFSFAATVGGVFGLQSGGFLTEDRGWRSVFVLSIVLAAGITVGAAISRWRGTAAPVAPSIQPGDESPAAVSPRVLLAPLLFNFWSFVNYSLFVSLPLYTERRFDASPEVNSNLLMVITVTHLLAAFPVGRMVRRWGAPPTLLLGLGVAALGTLLIRPAPETLWIALPLILYGLGQLAATTAAGDIVLQRGGRGGRAIGYVRLSSDLGLVVGPYLAGAVADFFGYGAPFLFLPAVTAVVALFALRWIRATAPNQEPRPS